MTTEIATTTIVTEVPVDTAVESDVDPVDIDPVDADLQRRQEEYFQAKLAKDKAKGGSPLSPLLFKKNRSMPLPMLNIGQTDLQVNYQYTTLLSPDCKKGKNMDINLSKNAIIGDYTTYLHNTNPNLHPLERDLYDTHNNSQKDGGGHLPSGVGKVAKPKNQSSNVGSDKVSLDGFLLLKVGKVELPEDLIKINLNERNISRSVEEDQVYFTNLSHIDASANALSLEHFAAFPSLVDLKLTCNNILRIPPFEEKYKNMKKILNLDLSYNALGVNISSEENCEIKGKAKGKKKNSSSLQCSRVLEESFSSLSCLPHLKSLNLSKNDITSLPSNLQKFRYLETLDLSHNGITSSAIFQALSTIPNLRELSLASNHLDTIEDEDIDIDCFSSLTYLDLTSNRFKSQKDIAAIVYLRKLSYLLVYGNPLTGYYGSDLTNESVKDIKALAEQVRNGWTHAQLEIVTDIPDKKRAPPMKKNKSTEKMKSSDMLCGRKVHNYRNFTITNVEEENDLKSGSPGAESPEKKAENLLRAKDFQAAGNKVLFDELIDISEGKPSYKYRYTFANQDDVVDAMEDVTKTFITGLNTESKIGPNARKINMNMLQNNIEVPKFILQRSLHPEKKGNVGKLRAAVAALRFALQNPVTAVFDPTRPRKVDRPTASIVAKQMPKHAFKMKKIQQEQEEITLGRRTQSRKHTSQDKTMRKNGDDMMKMGDKSLGNMNHTLDNMNQTMEEVVNNDVDVLTNKQKVGKTTKEFGMKKLVKLVDGFIETVDCPIPPVELTTKY